VTELIIISGPPNSGKHPLADTLATNGHMALISRDRLREAIRIKDEWIITLAMADLARGLLLRGVSCVVCAWNLEPEDRQLWEGLAVETGSELDWLDTRSPQFHKLIPPLKGWTPLTYEETK
jgi:predicted kinase